MWDTLRPPPAEERAAYYAAGWWREETFLDDIARNAGSGPTTRPSSATPAARSNAP